MAVRKAGLPNRTQLTCNSKKKMTLPTMALEDIVDGRKWQKAGRWVEDGQAGRQAGILMCRKASRTGRQMTMHDVTDPASRLQQFGLWVFIVTCCFTTMATLCKDKRCQLLDMSAECQKFYKR